MLWWAEFLEGQNEKDNKRNGFLLMGPTSQEGNSPDVPLLDGFEKSAKFGWRPNPSITKLSQRFKMFRTQMLPFATPLWTTNLCHQYGKVPITASPYRHKSLSAKHYSWCQKLSDGPINNKNKNLILVIHKRLPTLPLSCGQDFRKCLTLPLHYLQKEDFLPKESIIGIHPAAIFTVEGCHWPQFWYTKIFEGHLKIKWNMWVPFWEVPPNLYHHVPTKYMGYIWHLGEDYGNKLPGLPTFTFWKTRNNNQPILQNPSARFVNKISHMKTQGQQIPPLKYLLQRAKLNPIQTKTDPEIPPNPQKNIFKMGPY